MSEDEPADSEEPLLIGTDFKVSASEKTSTGEYENYSPHLSIEGKIPMKALDEETREELKEEMLGLHGDLQAVLNRSVGNRHAEPEWEDWSFGDEGPDVKSVEDLGGSDGERGDDE